MAKLIKNYFSNFEDITEYYNFLVHKTKNHEYVDITNEWLIDNYYILVEHKNTITESIKKIRKNIRIINRNYPILKNIVSKKNYNIDFKFLVEELKEYQKETKKSFTYEELQCMMPTLIFLYTERLNNLCREEYAKIVDKEDIDAIIKQQEKITLKSFIQDNFDIKNNGHFIFELNNQLYRLKNYNELFKELNEYSKYFEKARKYINYKFRIERTIKLA